MGDRSRNLQTSIRQARRDIERANRNARGRAHNTRVRPRGPAFAPALEHDEEQPRRGWSP